MDNNNSESESGTDSDYDEDISAQQRETNLKNSEARKQVDPVLSPVKSKARKTKKDAATQAAIKVFCEKHIGNMMKSHNTSEFIVAFMAIRKVKSSTFWEKHISMFMFVSLTSEIDVFNWVQPRYDRAAVCIPQSDIPTYHWAIPIKPRLSPELTKTIEGIPQVLKTK